MVYIPNSCILKSQGLQVPTKVFVLVIFTQLLVKHQNIINPVGFNQVSHNRDSHFCDYHNIDTNLLSRYIELSLLSPSPIYIYMFVTLIVCIIPCTECEITVLNDSM